MTSLISIIIPSFNEDKYIDECINSLINQTYRNIQIILIDDGSNKETADYYDKLAKKDSRIEVFHITNGGVSRARNFGLTISRGKYIVFADADDYYSSNSIEYLVNNSNNVELVISDYTRVKSQFNFNKNNEISETISSTKAITYFLNFKKAKCSTFVNESQSSYFNSVWAKLYLKSVIDNNKIMFNTDCKYGEDLLFNLEYLKHIENVRLLNEVIYYYRNHEKSATHKFSLSDLESILKQIDCMMTIEHEEGINYVVNNLISTYIYSINTKDISIINKTLDYIKKHRYILCSTNIEFKGLQGVVYSVIFSLWKMKLYSVSKMVAKLYIKGKKYD